MITKVALGNFRRLNYSNCLNLKLERSKYLGLISITYSNSSVSSAIKSETRYGERKESGFFLSVCKAHLQINRIVWSYLFKCFCFELFD